VIPPDMSLIEKLIVSPQSEAVLAVAVGLIVSFYAFWDLQFGVYDRHWGWYFGVLAACFLLIAYGAYVLMELPQDTPKKAELSLGDKVRLHYRIGVARGTGGMIVSGGGAWWGEKII
jgi:hypothetical protein